MSNRYTLAWGNGDVFVVDHDNAGDRRRAETLSGGELMPWKRCVRMVPGCIRVVKGAGESTWRLERQG